MDELIMKQSSTTSDTLDEEESKIQLLYKRRYAFRKKNIFIKNGHKFENKEFTYPIRCTFCSEFIWAVNRHGYKCISCACSVHKKCFDKLLTSCKTCKDNQEIQDQDGERLSSNVPHTFLEKYFFKITFCDYCGHMLALYKPEKMCICCGYACHKDYCLDNVGLNCGVDQKQVHETLSDINTKKLIPKALRKLQVNQASSSFKIESQITNRMSTRSQQTFDKEEKKRFSDRLVSKLHLNKFYHKRPESLDSQTTDIRKQSTKNNKASSLHLYDINLLKLVGTGGYGKVFLVTVEKQTNKQAYAMKAITKELVVRDALIKSITSEKETLILGHRNSFLTRLYAAFQDDNYIFFLMEFLNGGDLVFHLEESKKFTEERAKFYAAEIICGLQFLHSENIIYRDLKLDNILLDSEGHCKLGDFGLAIKLSGDALAETICGTPQYLAPEILLEEKYDYSVDYWSLGVVLFEMLTGNTPFMAKYVEDMYELIKLEEPNFPSNLSESCIAILEDLLEKDPANRLGCNLTLHGEIREHKYFGEIDWIRLERKELEPPFKPNILLRCHSKSHELDVSNFSNDQTRNKPQLSLLELKSDSTMLEDPDMFKDFDYTSSELHLI